MLLGTDHSSRLLRGAMIEERAPDKRLLLPAARPKAAGPQIDERARRRLESRT